MFLLDNVIYLLWVEEGEDILISALSLEVPGSARKQGARQISVFINSLLLVRQVGDILHICIM